MHLGYRILVLTTYCTLLYNYMYNYSIGDVGKCDPGWTELQGTSVCYLFSNNSVSWRDAKRTCLLDQGHLVDIQSIKERVSVIQSLKEITKKVHLGTRMF